MFSYLLTKPEKRFHLLRGENFFTRIGAGTAFMRRLTREAPGIFKVKK